MKLTETEFVLLDVETCNPNDPQVIELAGLRFVAHRPLEADHFKETFIYPNMKIDPTTQSVHHIGDDDVVNAPLLSEVDEEWGQWVADRTIIAYNSDFDRTSLRNTSLFHKNWMDAYRASMHFWSLGMENDDGFPLTSLKQQELRYWLKLPTIMGDAHRAAADIQVTAYILERIIDKYLDCGHPDDYDSFVAFIEGPIFHDTLPLGGRPYQGKRVHEVEDWALKKAFDPDNDMHEGFKKFNMLDCLLPEYISRFGHTPQQAPKPRKKTPKLTDGVVIPAPFKPASSPPKPTTGPRWKRS